MHALVYTFLYFLLLLWPMQYVYAVLNYLPLFYFHFICMVVFGGNLEQIAKI